MSYLLESMISKGDGMDKRNFTKMKNGYNRYQVDDYIQKQRNQIDALERRLAIANREIELLNQEKNMISEQFRALNENLKVKEEAAGEMARMTMREANLIVDTANHNADTIVKEALMMAREILLEITRLGDEANGMKSSMREELHRIEVALDEFETPSIPSMDLLSKED